MIVFRKALAAFAILSLAACSSASKKKDDSIHLSELEGKKVALVELEGEATSRKVVEVALINQLLQHGSFEIVSKQDVDAARMVPEQDPTDWKGIAKRAGADFALKAKVLDFDATTREGYSSEEVDDSQLETERGPGQGKTQRYFKAKSMTGTVRVWLEFTSLSNGDSTNGIAAKTQTVSGEERDEGIHLPPKLRFLEGLANDAFKEFFARSR